MVTPMAHVLAQYLNRRRLAKLGFVEPLENLDALTAEFFIFIAMEIGKIEAEKAKGAGK